MVARDASETSPPASGTREAIAYTRSMAPAGAQGGCLVMTVPSPPVRSAGFRIRRFPVGSETEALLSGRGPAVSRRVRACSVGSSRRPATAPLHRSHVRAKDRPSRRRTPTHSPRVRVHSERPGRGASASAPVPPRLLARASAIGRARSHPEIAPIATDPVGSGLLLRPRLTAWPSGRGPIPVCAPKFQSEAPGRNLQRRLGRCGRRCQAEYQDHETPAPGMHADYHSWSLRTNATQFLSGSTIAIDRCLAAMRTE